MAVLRSRVMRLAVGLLLLATSSACASARVAAPIPEGLVTLPLRVSAVVDSPPLDQLHWGILATDPETGRVLYARHPEKKFIPASNMKVLVTTAALHLLGPDHRFVTRLTAVGSLDGPVLDGDLVVAGTGDPTLSERFWESDLAPLEALADSVAATGVRQVRGRLLVDASAFDSVTVAGSWMSFNLMGSFSANPGAFAVAEGETSLVVQGAERAGEPATVQVTPAGTADFVLAEVVTADSAASPTVAVSYLPESRRLHVTGRVPAGGTRRMSVATRDPVRQSAAALQRALESRGITFDGGVEVVWEPDQPLGGGCRSGAVEGCAGARTLASLESPPLIEIVEGVLEPSQNWMTEQLVRSLGVSDTTRGGWGTGLRAVERFLVDEVGVDSLDFSLHDGSGLSAYNLVTPRALVAALGHALASPYGDAYVSALAEPGEEEGTLRSRLEPMEGRLWAKTGTISNVNALSGVLIGAPGEDGSGSREILFSILTNGSGLPSSVVRDAMDEVVMILSEIPPR